MHLAKKYFKLALEAGTSHVDNENPVKVRVVKNLCLLFHDLENQQEYAIKMASEYLTYIPKQNLNDEAV